MTWGLLWFTLPAAALGYGIATLIYAARRAAEIAQMHENLRSARAASTTLDSINAQLETRLAQLEENLRSAQLALQLAEGTAARLADENGALALQLAEATAKKRAHAQLPAKLRPRRADYATGQGDRQTGADGETV